MDNREIVGDMPRHGGDLAFARARYPDFRGEWLDLSTGINPVAYPLAGVHVDHNRLPAADLLAGLIEAAHSTYAIPAGVPVIAVPGSELAIQLLPLFFPRGRIAIVGPTYGSHAQAWRNGGHHVSEVGALDAAPAEASVAVVANPNNPDGRVLPAEFLADHARRLAARGGLLVVDEAFADVAPGASICPHLASAPAIIFRSFGKFYGLAGIRLGFVAGTHQSVRQLASRLGDWPVSSAAVALGTAALSDLVWREKMCARLKRSTAALHKLLATVGLTVAGFTELFTLIEDGRAKAIHEALAREGIWTRTFPDQPNRLRLGLTPDKWAFRRLADALARATWTASTG